MRRPVAPLLVLGLLIVGAFGTASVVSADHLDVEASLLQDSVTTGESIELRVAVRTAEGQRLPDATVIAYRQAEVAGISRQLELARGITDQLGIAALQWQERSPSTHPITIVYAGPGDADFEDQQDLLEVNVTSGAQLERSSSGLRIPGFGAWTLIALLAGVWGLIQYALLGPVHVAADDIATQDALEDEEVPT